MLLRWIGYGLLRPLFMHRRHRNHWSTWSDVLLFSFFFENIKKKKKWLQICASRRFDRLQSALISIDVSPPLPSPLLNILAWEYWEKRASSGNTRASRQSCESDNVTHVFVLFVLFISGKIFRETRSSLPTTPRNFTRNNYSSFSSRHRVYMYSSF